MTAEAEKIGGFMFRVADGLTEPRFAGPMRSTANRLREDCSAEPMIHRSADPSGAYIRGAAAWNDPMIVMMIDTMMWRDPADPLDRGGLSCVNDRSWELMDQLLAPYEPTQ